MVIRTEFPSHILARLPQSFFTQAEGMAYRYRLLVILVLKR